jgi:hypothetical protein
MRLKNNDEKNAIKKAIYDIVNSEPKKEITAFVEIDPKNLS